MGVSVTWKGVLSLGQRQCVTMSRERVSVWMFGLWYPEGSRTLGDSHPAAKVSSS